MVSTVLHAQIKDSTSLKKFPHHYFSVNLINCLAIDQAGINYEYYHGRWGIGATVGYKYAGGRNYSRLLISGTTQEGSFEYYDGFFINPQLNFYLSKPKSTKTAKLCYLALKINYKYLYMDSTNWIIYGGTGDRPYYHKGIDKVNILSPYVFFGVKYVARHFFIDFNLGPGWTFVGQSMLVVGDSQYHPSNFNQRPPYKAFRGRDHFSFTLNLNIGGAF